MYPSGDFLQATAKHPLHAVSATVRVDPLLTLRATLVAFFKMIHRAWKCESSEPGVELGGMGVTQSFMGVDQSFMCGDQSFMCGDQSFMCGDQTCMGVHPR